MNVGAKKISTKDQTLKMFITKFPRNRKAIFQIMLGTYFSMVNTPRMQKESGVFNKEECFLKF